MFPDDDKNMLVRPKQEIGRLARHLDEVRVETKSRTFFKPSDVTRTHPHLRKRRAAVAHPPKAILLRLKYACVRVPRDGSQIYQNTHTRSHSCTHTNTHSHALYTHLVSFTEQRSHSAESRTQNMSFAFHLSHTFSLSVTFSL